MKSLTLIAATILAVCAGPGVSNAEWPKDRPISLVVANAAGGTSDLTARLLAAKISEALGQSVIVENRPGGGTIVAATYVMNSKPDGYTLFLGQGSTFGILPAGKKDLPYDPVKSFTPIGQISKYSNAILVNAKLPVKNMDDLVKYVKEHPGKVNYTGSGYGSTLHLTGELINQIAGIDMLFIPYPGGAQSVAAAIAGDVQVVIDNLPTALEQMKGDALRGLAIASVSRSPLAPDLPALTESEAFKSQQSIIMDGFFGIMGPAAMPETIVKRLNSSLNEILKKPEVMAAYSRMASEPVGGAPDDLARLIDQQLKGWKVIIDRANIKLE
jgi:tripartite-type tricarboxylate transporter receptor subunit TctC